MIGLAWKETIRSLVDEAQPYSFGDPQRIREWAELFVEAHHAAPGGLSLEIGTWRGGTAFVFLRLLERLYPAHERPMLFTIDPYGDKPYNGGDGKPEPLYGNNDYVIMKKLLARFPNHAHFYMTSDTFFGNVGEDDHALDFWWSGKQSSAEKQVVFALIDGEHDVLSIENDVRNSILMARHGAIIVVDNIDNDPRTEDKLLASSLKWRSCAIRQAALRRADGEPQRYAVVRDMQKAEAACQ